MTDRTPVELGELDVLRKALAAAPVSDGGELAAALELTSRALRSRSRSGFTLRWLASLPGLAAELPAVAAIRRLLDASVTALPPRVGGRARALLRIVLGRFFPFAHFADPRVETGLARLLQRLVAARREAVVSHVFVVPSLRDADLVAAAAGWCEAVQAVRGHGSGLILATDAPGGDPGKSGHAMSFDDLVRSPSDGRRLALLEATLRVLPVRVLHDFGAATAQRLVARRAQVLPPRLAVFASLPHSGAGALRRHRRRLALHRLLAGVIVDDPQLARQLEKFAGGALAGRVHVVPRPLSPAHGARALHGMIGYA